MEAIPGFVSVPRLTGANRPAGAFFSAVVEGPAGPHAWKVVLDGRSLTVSSDLSLVPGQVLKLKLVSSDASRWTFQVVAEAPRAASSDPSPLAAAFLSKGLPLAADRLAAWSRWIAKPGPSDKEAWAASLETRGERPHGPLSEAVRPWLDWQSALEQGRSEPPPEDDSVWEQWNRRPAAGETWLVMPLRWEYNGVAEAGLLQAHWNAAAERIDRWQVTAAPAATPFRLEALSKPGSLALTWRFFVEDQRRRWEAWAQTHASALSAPGEEVTLRIAGPPEVESAHRGIDVQA